MEDALLITTTSLLQRDWGLPIAQDTHDRSWEALSVLLAQHLAELLERDLPRLVNILYRLDVPEQHFHAAMSAPSLGERSRQLADAVLARERLRAEMRLRYSSTPTSGGQTGPDIDR